MKIQLLLLALLSLSCWSVNAQKFCATPEPDPSQRRYLQETLYRLADQVGLARNAGTTCIPIRLYIFREDDGSAGLDEASMARGLAFLNKLYQVAGIEFYYASRAYFDDSDVYHFDQRSPDNDTENDITSTAGESNDAINMYVVNEIFLNGGFQAAGYAYLPYGDFNLYNRIVMTDVFFSLQLHGTLSHELGHYFGLLHTHSFTENGNMDARAEAVPRFGPQSDCGTDGDMICDTQADPAPNANNMSGCSYTGNDGMGGTEADEYGNFYTPPLDNIMSYYSGFCQDQIFTPGQYAVIQQGLSTRQGFTSNTLDAPPMVVAVPTNVTANLDDMETGIEISWQDAANNEFGYVLERSTSSSSSGFIPLAFGAVASDVTSYTDTDIAENSTYHYRVKPINGDCNNYSGTASYSVGELYCMPSITQCDEYMERVMVGSIDNNSSAAGCNNGDGFTRYTQTTNMERSETYFLQAFTNRTYPGDELGVWIDWDQNGELDDVGEFYNLGGPTATNTFSGNIVVPTEAVLGPTRMRIRLSYTPNDALAPCGNQDFGEIEDYTIQVLAAPLPVEWQYVRAFAQNEGIRVEWATSLERDNDFFVVERLFGNNEWEQIGQVDGRNGNGSLYEFLDETPRAGDNYYRLRQVDYSGEWELSEVVKARWNSDYLIDIYPNPVQNQLYLSFSEQAPDRVRLLNAIGQVVLDRKIHPNERNLILEMEHLPESCYFVVAINTIGETVLREQVVLMK